MVSHRWRWPHRAAITWHDLHLSHVSEIVSTSEADLLCTDETFLEDETDARATLVG